VVGSPTVYMSVLVVSDDLRLRGLVKWTKNIDISSLLPRSRVCDHCDRVTLVPLSSKLLLATYRNRYECGSPNIHMLTQADILSQHSWN
jgi:hypothetical protein